LLQQADFFEEFLQLPLHNALDDALGLASLSGLRVVDALLSGNDVLWNIFPAQVEGI
jgi:hypothetical protein